MAWSIRGQYFETCNCAFLCPCITNLAARPTEGECKVALTMKIDKGEKDGVTLDGICFIMLLHSPGPMANGNFTVGLIVDDKATGQQTDALAAITSGAVGGPMEHLSHLVGRVAGIEKRPIRFERDGRKYSVTAGELIDQALEGLTGPAKPGEPIFLDNVGHPVASKLALAKATRSKFHAFGIDWNDASGTRNGHFAPFAWAG